MALVSVLLGLGAAAASCLLTYVIWRNALVRGLFDVPNERSSHRVPTPRGGGLAIVLTSMTCFALLGATGRLHVAIFAALSGGLLVAGVGWLDDRRSLTAGLRIAVHLGAALLAVMWLGGLPSLQVGDQLISLGWIGYVLGVLGLVWVMNLFNFMDGIDGLAAGEAICVLGAGALLTLLVQGPGEIPWAGWLGAAACLGFLPWNWPRARIFLGDVGSGYLGFVIAVLALAAARGSAAALWSWLILGGVFIVDATVTLLRRLARGERIHEAHRSHGYQWLARRWGSHAKVTSAVLLVNVLWLLPCAALAANQPRFAALAAMAAFTPLVLVSLIVSGRREATPRAPDRAR